MARFRDVALPSNLAGFGAVFSPRFSTDITRVDSGAEQANVNWQSPLYRISLPQGIRDQATYNDLLDHWMAMKGPAYTFPLRNPLDFASVAVEAANVAPTVSRTDQPLGTGDGVTRDFQLVRRYTRGGYSTDRTVLLPVSGSVVVGVDGADPSTLSPALSFTVSRPGGVVSFSAPPGPGAVLTAGFLFDVPVRFESDDTLDGVFQTYQVAGFADIPLMEVRDCD